MCALNVNKNKATCSAAAGRIDMLCLETTSIIDLPSATAGMQAYVGGWMDADDDYWVEPERDIIGGPRGEDAPNNDAQNNCAVACAFLARMAMRERNLGAGGVIDDTMTTSRRMLPSDEKATLYLSSNRLRTYYKYCLLLLAENITNREMLQLLPAFQRRHRDDYFG